jgi:CubicO group peptidase (beta-lactamase class C family)
LKRRFVTLLLAAAAAAPHGVAAQSPHEVRSSAAASFREGTAPAIPRSVHPAASTVLADLDQIVARAMSEWSVPGVAVAVVADGEIVLSRGYGERHRESGLPVTAATLFPIASLTKPFTATVLASLAEEGRLAWDRPVVEYLPDFRLQDEALTKRVTARDLLTHQAGLPRHDFVWYGADLSSRELYERLRFLEAGEPAGWQYQNLMFMAAGYLAAEVTGRSWEELLRERLFAPLRMNAATSLQELKQRANIAFPYAEGPNGARRVPFRSMDAVGPAGSISASADDMSHLVLMYLSEGAFEGTPVVSPAVVHEMLEPHVGLPADALDPELGESSYGLGLVLSEYAGHRMAHHEGGVDGFVSLMSLLPDPDIGIVVLTNYSGENPLPWIITRAIYDRLLEIERVDWIARAQETETERRSARQETRLTGIPRGTWSRGPSRPLPADYVGSYAHPAYGEVDIVFGDDGLQMRFHGIDANLEGIGSHGFRVAGGSLAGLRLTFLGNAANRIDRVAIPWEPAVSDIVFVRRLTAARDDDGSDF